MRRRKSLKEKQAENKRIEKHHQEQYNRAIQKKADELNKIMSRGTVSREGDRYSVRLKNGQVFKFRFYPAHLFKKDKILLVLDGVEYEN